MDKNSDYIFKAFIVNSAEYDNGNKETSGTWLYFPTTKEEVSAAFEKIGLPQDAKPGQYFIDECTCILESLNPLVDINTDIHELAETAKQLDTLDGFQMLKLNAVMETDAAFETLAEVKEFTYNRDYYNLEPDVSDHTELGLSCIYKSGAFDTVPDYYKDAIVPAAFGKYIAEAERGIFTSKGYLYPSGDEWQAVDLQNFKPKPLIHGADERPIDATEHFAADLDSFYRSISTEYSQIYDDEIQARYYIAALMQTGRTAELKEQIYNMQKEYYLDNADVQPFLKRIENFEHCKGNYLENAEMQVEQNYNHIDGVINNEPAKESEEQNMSDKMKVLVVEPMQEPYVKEIDSSLKSLQSEVGGNIQAVYPFEEEAAVICNEEGKMNGLELNRALYDDNGRIYDIIAGTFLICGLTGDSFGSLPDDLINKFSEQFKQPETFVKIGHEIISIPAEPIKQPNLNITENKGIINFGASSQNTVIHQTTQQIKTNSVNMRSVSRSKTAARKKPSVKKTLEQAKKEQGDRGQPKPPRKSPPEL